MRVAQVLLVGLLTTLAPGTAAAFSSTTLSFSPYVPGSRPSAEIALTRIGDGLQISNYVELASCPFEFGKKAPLVAIYAIESRDRSAGSFFVSSRSGEWISEHFGASYGEDFTLVSDDSIDCHPNDCLVELVRGLHRECLVDDFGNRRRPLRWWQAITSAISSFVPGK